jgi:hypothetical protein
MKFGFRIPYPFYSVCVIQIHIRNIRQADWRLDTSAVVETLRGHQWPYLARLFSNPKTL